MVLYFCFKMKTEESNYGNQILFYHNLPELWA